MSETNEGTASKVEGKVSRTKITKERREALSVAGMAVVGYALGVPLDAVSHDWGGKEDRYECYSSKNYPSDYLWTARLGGCAAHILCMDCPEEFEGGMNDEVDSQNGQENTTPWPNLYSLMCALRDRAVGILNRPGMMDAVHSLADALMRPSRPSEEEATAIIKTALAQVDGDGPIVLESVYERDFARGRPIFCDEPLLAYRA